MSLPWWMKFFPDLPNLGGVSQDTEWHFVPTHVTVPVALFYHSLNVLPSPSECELLEG